MLTWSATSVKLANLLSSPFDNGKNIGAILKMATVAKMASHAIFQYNILVIDDTHNTWTNMIVKINIPRLSGSSDDKEKIGVARPEGPPLRWSMKSP